jgi:copper chaperone CopZ
MERKTYKVRGMHCPGCEKLLEMDIAGLPGVAAVKADCRKGAVEVQGEGVRSELVEKAIRDNGYKI